MTSTLTCVTVFPFSATRWHQSSNILNNHLFRLNTQHKSREVGQQVRRGVILWTLSPPTRCVRAYCLTQNQRLCSITTLRYTKATNRTELIVFRWSEFGSGFNSGDLRGNCHLLMPCIQYGLCCFSSGESGFQVSLDNFLDRVGGFRSRHSRHVAAGRNAS